MRRLRVWGSILVSAVLIWVAFRGQDLSAMADALRSAEYWYLAPALALYFAGVWVRAARWSELLSPLGRYRIRGLFPIVVIGYMANDVLPARMGEVVRVYVLAQRERLSKASALGTVVVERLLDAITMLFLLAVAALAVPLTGAIERVALVAAVVLLAGLAPLLTLAIAPDFALRVAAPLVRRLPGGAPARLSDAGAGFVAGLRVLRHGRVIAWSLGLSLAAWLLEAGMYWVLAQGFHLPVSPSQVVLTLAVANLATLVPSAPGYVGSFEVAALLVLSGLVGIDRELATGYLLVLHAALVIPVTLLGFAYWGAHHLSLSRIRREMDPSTQA